MKQKKKLLIVFVVVLAIALILVYLNFNKSKSDDWVYNSDMQYILNEIAVFAIPIVVGIAIITYSVILGI